MTEARPVAHQHDPADQAPGGVPGATPLRRSREHKVIGGVCGGLGRYCDVDPVIFRVVLAVLAVTGGVGLLVYGLCWLLIPLHGEDDNEGRRLLSGRVEGTALTAVLFVLVGCGLFLSMLNDGHVVAFTLMLSMATVAAAHWSQRRRFAESGEVAADPATAHAVADAPPETKAPPPSRTGPSWWRDPLVKDGTTGHMGTGYLWGPDDGHGDDGTVAAARRCHRPVRERTSIGGRTFLLACTAAAIGTGTTWTSRPLGTSLQIGLSAALIVFGLGLLISAWYGRTGAGTLLVAVLTSALLAGATALPESVTSRWTHRTWAPKSAAAVPESYRMGAGVARLKLTELRLPKDQTVSVRAEVGAGRLVLTVPSDALVHLDVSLGLGDLRLPGKAKEDVDVSPAVERSTTFTPKGGGPPRGTLDVEVELGLGQVEVIRN